MGSITNRRGYSSHQNLADYIDDFFNRNYRRRVGSYDRMEDSDMTLPAVNVSESEDAFVLEMAAPGFEKNDFNIEVENGVLTISARKAEEKENGKQPSNRYTRREFRYHSFQRAFTLPENVVEDDIEATYVNGILLLTLPVKGDLEDSRRPRRIAIG